MIQMIDPALKEPLRLSEDGSTLELGNGVKRYSAKEGVFSFLETPDTFYEGAYLNNIKFVPRSKSWFHQWPLWFEGDV